jgi:hypothetical protein
LLESDANETYLRRENRFVALFLFLVFLTLAHFVHDGWRTRLTWDAEHPSLANNPYYYLFRPAPPPLHAPEAYRVAIPALGRFLVTAFHVQDPAYVAAALDFCFGFLAAYLLYRAAVEGLPVSTQKTQRMLLVALFLAFLQFPLAWVVPWQRPETLPSALYLAFALWCLIHATKTVLWTPLLLLATLCQTLVRSDVPFVFGIGLVLTSMMGYTLASRPRTTGILKGVAIALIGGGTQAYLQFVRYPHLTYWPGTEVFPFRTNLLFHNLSNFSIALLPFLILAGFAVVKRVRLDAVDMLLVMTSALYLPVWFAVGIVGEVRVGAPFLMALCPVAAKVSAAYLLRGAPSAQNI